MQNPSNEQGSLGSVITIVLLAVLFVGASAFGIWAFMSRSEYKNSSDKLSDAAVEKALAAQKTQLEKEFQEKEKQPFDTFSGPSESGSVKLQFPKTWELYSSLVANGAVQVDGFAHPGFVPGLQSGTPYALRFQVQAQEYTAFLQSFDAQVKAGKARVSPFRLEKVPSVLGARVDGLVDAKNTGSMVIFPLRDKTLKVWTENTTYLNDFNTLLKTLTFAP